jgi:hypothetical protein
MAHLGLYNLIVPEKSTPDPHDLVLLAFWLVSASSSHPRVISFCFRPIGRPRYFFSEIGNKIGNPRYGRETGALLGWPELEFWPAQRALLECALEPCSLPDTFLLFGQSLSEESSLEKNRSPPNLALQEKWFALVRLQQAQSWVVSLTPDQSFVRLGFLSAWLRTATLEFWFASSIRYILPTNARICGLSSVTLDYALVRPNSEFT